MAKIRRVKRRDQSKMFNVNGHVVKCTTVQGLGLAVGRSRDTILLYHREGIFPDPPLKKGQVRYYTLSLVEKLIPLVKRLYVKHVMDHDVRAEIHKAFEQERTLLLCPNSSNPQQT